MKKLMYIAMMFLFLVSCDDDDGLVGNWVASLTSSGGGVTTTTEATLNLSSTTFQSSSAISVTYNDVTTDPITCQSSGDWSSTDTELFFTINQMSGDCFSEDLSLPVTDTTQYVLAGDSLTLGSTEDGTLLIYSRD